jgi:hypothetical protein
LDFETSYGAAGISLFSLLNGWKFRQLNQREKSTVKTEIRRDASFANIRQSMGAFSTAIESCQSAFHSKHGIVLGSPEPYWKIAGQFLQDSGQSAHSFSPTLCSPEPCGNVEGQLAQDSEQSTSSFNPINPTLCSPQPCGNVEGQLLQDSGESAISFDPTGVPGYQGNGFGIAAHQPSGTPDHVELNGPMGSMLNC